MKSGAVFLSVLSSVLVFSLVWGGLIHAVVPHDDGDAHHHDRALIAASLHSALMHEDKKTAALIAMLWVFAFFVVRRVFVWAYIFVLTRRGHPYLYRKDTLSELLRRGVFAYRKFT